MAIDFPNNPVNGNTYTYQDTEYMFTQSSGQEGYWKVVQPIASGIANVQEINDGQEPIKYITPENLELSKYNKETDWRVQLTNPASVIRTVGRTYLGNVSDKRNLREGSTRPEKIMTQAQYPTSVKEKPVLGVPIIFDRAIKITKVTFVADRVATAINHSGVHVNSPKILLNMQGNFPNSGGIVAANIYMDIDDSGFSASTIVGEASDVRSDLNNNVPNTDRVRALTSSNWSGISIPANTSWGINWIPEYQTISSPNALIAAVSNFEVLVEGVYV